MGYRFHRGPRIVRAWGWLGLALCLLQATAAAPPAAAETAEHLAMPFACTVAGGQIEVRPASERRYAIRGNHAEQPFALCGAANRCRTLALHRFDLDCAGTRVAWSAVVAAAHAYLPRRVRVEAGRLLMPTGQARPLAVAQRCGGRPGALADPRRRMSVRECLARSERMVDAVALPAGFAPLGIMRAHIVLETLPAPAADAASPAALVSSAPRAGAPVESAAMPSPAPQPAQPTVASPSAPVAPAGPSAPTVAAASPEPARTASAPKPAAVAAAAAPAASAATPAAGIAPHAPPASAHTGTEMPRRSPAASPSPKSALEPARPAERVGGWVTTATPEPAVHVILDRLTTWLKAWPLPGGSASLAAVAVLLLSGTAVMARGSGARRRIQPTEAAATEAPAPEPALKALAPPADRTDAEPDADRAAPGAEPAIAVAPVAANENSRPGHEAEIAAQGAAEPPDTAAFADTDPDELATDELSLTAERLNDLVHHIVEEMVPDGPLRELLQGELVSVDRRLASMALAQQLAGQGFEQSRPMLEQVVADLQRIRTLARIEHERALGNAANQNTVPASRDEAIEFLGLNRAAGEKIAKKVVDALRQAWHPDLAQDEADRARRVARIKQINAAWDAIRTDAAA